MAVRKRPLLPKSKRAPRKSAAAATRQAKRAARRYASAVELVMDATLAEIENGSAKSYDPQAVDAWLQHFREDRFAFAN